MDEAFTALRSWNCRDGPPVRKLDNAARTLQPPAAAGVSIFGRRGLPLTRIVFSLAAVGGLPGSLITNRLERRIGLPAAVIGKHILVAALFPILLLDLPLYGVGIVWAAISFQVSIVGAIQRKVVFLSSMD